MKKMFLKLFGVALLVASAAFAQAPVTCYSGVVQVQNCPVAQQLTDATYWASKDPKVVAVHSLPDIASRYTAATTLNAAGFIIDYNIDVVGWDPVITMQTRALYGYSWVPNAFQPNLVDPLHLGVVPSGQTATDMTKPWVGSIKVSTYAPDYPSVAPPPPPAVIPSVDPVGFDYGNGTYGVNLAAVTSNGQYLYKNGDTISHNGTTLYFNNVLTPFGPSLMWSIKAPLQ